ncbi:LysR substrate-binding domain-containing protein [Streptomyces sp. NBC_00724]|uniref:LysR substrate-binding domain-containing protein n=1 Tax=Streptomyces sp. NBC_00724 TaxID=2975812 RepID=UPI002ED074A7|nr:LysR substrate-binding domain-containing protein [Streptomyces sp. NBC_00724]WTI92134.1 LysR substrate-binding domain-containing protein [Streptomyces sp. NBC_00724]
MFGSTDVSCLASGTPTTSRSAPAARGQARGLDANSSLRRWIEKHLGPHAPAVRHRTTVTDLGVLISLAAAGAGLVVVPRRAIDPRQSLEVCELQELGPPPPSAGLGRHRPRHLDSNRDTR